MRQPLRPIEQPRHPVEIAHAAELLSGRSPAAADRFAYIQDQLRRLGATYYLLESWGDEQPLYRFYCKMAIGGNAGYTRYFEATDANPLQAMVQVLREVEAWRNGKNLPADSLRRLPANDIPSVWTVVSAGRHMQGRDTERNDSSGRIKGNCAVTACR